MQYVCSYVYHVLLCHLTIILVLQNGKTIHEFPWNDMAAYDLFSFGHSNAHDYYDDILISINQLNLVVQSNQIFNYYTMSMTNK